MIRGFNIIRCKAPQILAIGLVFLVMASSGLAQMGARISSARDRQTTLDTVEKALSMEDAGLKARFAELRYPFRFVEPEQPTAVAGKDDEKPEPVVEEKPVIPDEVILEAIAAQLRPKGTLIRSDRRMIILIGPGGRDINLREGDEFSANYQGEQYSVTVSSVTTDLFSLKLNDTVISRPVFVTDESAVRFYRPEN